MSWHRVTILQNFRNRTFQNVIHLHNPDGLKTAEQIAGLVETQWIPPFRPVQFTQLLYFQLQVTEIQVATPPETFVKNIAINPTGSLTAALGILSWKLHLRTGLAGKRNRGRYFMAGITNGFIDLGTERLGAGTATTAMQTLVDNLTAAWAGNAPTSGLGLAIAHKDGSTPTLVTRIDFNNLPSALRSRRIGVGM